MTGNLGAEADFIQLEREVSDVVSAAVKFADESPFPIPVELYNDVLAE